MGGMHKGKGRKSVGGVLAIVLMGAWQYAGALVALPGTMPPVVTPPTATLPTSGTCGFEINNILATGENVYQYEEASHATTGTFGPFTLGLLGEFTFTSASAGTFSVSEITRSYAPSTLTPPVATTDMASNSSGTFAVTAQTTVPVVPGASVMTLTFTNGFPAVKLLVMPVNGGNTLLVQDQDGGSGGGVCQF